MNAISIKAYTLSTIVAIAALGGCVSVSNSGNSNILAGTSPISPISATAADIAAQTSGNYEVEPTHTTVVWRLTHMGLSNYTARFEKISGSLQFDAADPTKSSVNIAIDPNSVSTGLPNFNSEIAEKVFDAANFRTINFVSTGLTKTTDTTGDLAGNLTFRGVTKPVTLQVQFNGGRVHPFSGKRVMGISARGKIKRSDFGANNWLPMIGDDVELIIETEFLKK